jgi:hypothetical protein
MINPRSVATLGLGFGARATAVLGLLDLTPVTPPADESGGGRWLREAIKPRRQNDDEALLIALLL